MKLRIVALGHRLPSWVAEAYADYARRMPRALGLELVELKAGAARSRQEHRASRSLPRRSVSPPRPEASMLSRWTNADYRGRPPSSPRALGRWRDSALDAAFVIGSADGLAESIKHDANVVIALSALTLPHGLVRVMLVEQLYRAASLLQGHPYHRE